MRTSLCTALLIVGLLVGSASPLAAQPVPDEGQVAAGASVGIFVPRDGQFDNALTADGFIEGYLGRRLSLRGSLAYVSPEYQRGTDENERQIRFGADAIYNWEGGAVHPFAGAGIGFHWLQLQDNGENVGDSERKLGFSVLGGFEYFMSRQWTFKTEGRYQWVDDRPGVNPDGFALTFGVKRYF